MYKEVTIAQNYLEQLTKESKPIIGVHAVPYDDKYMEVIVNEKLKLSSFRLFFDQDLKIQWSKEAAEFKQKLEETFQTYLDCCSLQIPMGKNLILHYMEGDQNEWEKPEETEIEQYTLSIGFRDCHYYVYVSKRDIEEDFSACLSIEGDSDLFDSFESKMEDDYWEHIKLACARYKELCIVNNVEDWKEVEA